MKTKYLKILAYIKNKNIIENILLFGAIISANFASYIAFYDINALMIIDSTTVAKYLLGITVTFVIVSTAISIVLLLLQNLSLLVSDNDGLISKDKRRDMHDAIGNKIFKFILTMIIFIFIFIGLENSLIIILLLLGYVSALIIFNALFDSEEVPLEHNKKDDITIAQKLFGLLHPLSGIHVFSKNLNLQKAINHLSKGEYFEFILGKVGIIVILFSLALGVGRADYVENNIHVKINNVEKHFVLYITTDDGIGLFDRKLKQVSFISWGNVENLVFLSKKRRSVSTLFDNSSKN